MKIKKALVIGGGGLVGFGLVRAMRKELGAENVIVGDRIKLKDKNSVILDILKTASLEETISAVKPDIIIHLAAATNVNRCDQEPEWAETLNIEGTGNVIQTAGQIPVIYFSTDFVFSGTEDGLKNENDTPDPVSVYGKTKYQGEQVLINSTNPGGVIRISFPWYRFEEHPQGIDSRDTLYWIRQTLLKGEDVQAYTNVTAGWTAMGYLEKQFLSLVRKMLTRNIKILHLTGKKTATVYEVAKAIRENLIQQGNEEKNLGQVKKGFCEPETGKIASRPEKGGLNITLAESLGWNQPGVLQMIKNNP